MCYFKSPKKGFWLKKGYFKSPKKGSKPLFRGLGLIVLSAYEFRLYYEHIMTVLECPEEAHNQKATLNMNMLDIQVTLVSDKNLTYTLSAFLPKD